MPVFQKKINPQTKEVVPDQTQVLELKDVYTIPFSKQKVNELQKYFTDNVQLIVIDRTGKRYGCRNLAEFTDVGYEDLIDLKTGYADYHRSRRLMQQEQQQQNKGQLQKSGVR